MNFKMPNILAIIKITRPINILITFLVVIVASIICSDVFSLSQAVILSAISASIIAASGNVLNDYFDYEIDLVNRPDRPLPSKQMSPSFALSLYSALTLAGFLIAIYISWISFFIVFGTIIILLVYSYLLKGVPLLGNAAIAVCTGLAFIYGGVAVNNWEGAVIPAIFALLVNFIREIVKDVEDINGDLMNGVFTFPTKYGINAAHNLLVFLILVLIMATVYPIFTKIFSIDYLIMVLFSVDIILVLILKEIIVKKKINYSRISFLLKLTMIFGLIAIYFG